MMGEGDWIAAMRANPACTMTMLACADWLDEQESPIPCGLCRPSSRTCRECGGSGYVSNGCAARAELLRLMGEMGKVGQQAELCEDEWRGHLPEGLVARAGAIVGTNWPDPIDHRLAALEAYAAAPERTRAAWLAGLREMGPPCPECKGSGRAYERPPDTGSNYVHWHPGDCPACDGSGRVKW